MALWLQGLPWQKRGLSCETAVSMPGRHTDHRLVPRLPWGCPAPPQPASARTLAPGSDAHAGLSAVLAEGEPESGPGQGWC